MTVYTAVLSIVVILLSMVLGAWFLIALDMKDESGMFYAAIIEACVCVVTVWGVREGQK